MDGVNLQGTKQNPPHSYELEASVLGAILIDKDGLVKIADVLDTSDFYENRHQIIYEAILHLYENRSPIDVLTLSDRLNATGNLEMAGGPSYLAELTNYVPTASHIIDYAHAVAQKSLRRRLSDVNARFSELVKDETIELKDLVSEAESELFKVSQRHIKQNIVSLETILTESFDRL